MDKTNETNKLEKPCLIMKLGDENNEDTFKAVSQSEFKAHLDKMNEIRCGTYFNDKDVPES